MQHSGGVVQAEPSNPDTGRPIVLSLRDLSRLLGRGSAGPAHAQGGHGAGAEEDDDDDDDDYEGYRRAPRHWFPEVKEPQKAGKELLMSGEFGRVGHKIRSRRNDVNVTRLLQNRSSRLRAMSDKEDIANVRLQPSTASCKLIFPQNLVPNSNGTAVASYEANIYSAQFSAGLCFNHVC